MTFIDERPLVSVAILTWNRREHVVKAINSVLEQDYQPVEIVVVDSASDDGTSDFIADHYPQIKVIRLHRNLGCPEGRNVALANCSGEIIYALDDDGWLAQETLSICVSRFRQHPEAGVIACQIVAPEEEVSRAGEDDWSHTFSGGASAIRRSVLETAGHYPSDFFRQAEEGDLVLRMFENGYGILRCPQAIMYHERSPINRNDKLFLYYNCRNELYTVLRCYPWRYVVPALFQKIVTWNYLGLRRNALFHSIAGVISAFARSPGLIRERKPVSPEVIRKLWSMKVNSRNRAHLGGAERTVNRSQA
jgi:GT2 family glycosyltransferase